MEASRPHIEDEERPGQISFPLDGQLEIENFDEHSQPYGSLGEQVDRVYKEADADFEVFEIDPETI